MHRLPPDDELCLFRIAQEALTNVVRHAGPADADLWLRYQHDAIEIELTDDGGSHPSPNPKPTSAGNGGGHGLVGMRERVSVYGGELDAGPQPGGGYRLRAKLPFAS